MDLGTAGYRILTAGTRPFGCDDIAIGDLAEMDGRNIYRSGAVIEKGENLGPAALDGSYFPCMLTAQINVGGGDSGSVVLVRGIPAGVTSRTFSGLLGFTPLAEGLADLGLELCTTPDCGPGEALALLPVHRARCSSDRGRHTPAGRSHCRPETYGPRSTTGTVIVLPLAGFLKVTLVPHGSVLWATPMECLRHREAAGRALSVEARPVPADVAVEMPRRLSTTTPSLGGGLAQRTWRPA